MYRPRSIRGLFIFTRGKTNEMKKISIILAMIFVLSNVSRAQTTATEFFDAGYKKYEKQDYKGAILDYDRCIEKDPKNADAYKALGIYYLKLKDTNLAIGNFNKAIELDSDIDLGIHADELKQLTEQDIT